MRFAASSNQIHSCSAAGCDQLAAHGTPIEDFHNPARGIGHVCGTSKEVSETARGARDILLCARNEGVELSQQIPSTMSTTAYHWNVTVSKLKILSIGARVAQGEAGYCVRLCVGRGGVSNPIWKKSNTRGALFLRRVRLVVLWIQRDMSQAWELGRS